MKTRLSSASTAARLLDYISLYHIILLPSTTTTTTTTTTTATTATTATTITGHVKTWLE